MEGFFPVCGLWLTFWLACWQGWLQIEGWRWRNAVMEEQTLKALPCFFAGVRSYLLGTFPACQPASTSLPVLGPASHRRLARSCTFCFSCLSVITTTNQQANQTLSISRWATTTTAVSRLLALMLVSHPCFSTSVASRLSLSETTRQGLFLQGTVHPGIPFSSWPCGGTQLALDGPESGS
ncbi:hypothetical protein BGZ61DRAFT_227539 [Ilyonectria robusta]|uniref:uncharacterized protein n=1 Tax=Ilyonectria robusta TaxID=1079257 RepID=UPI001E8CCDFE|nr:uncharacterized protein BGZ61DRAFT_227539 [Ilyonectria robusta]KAH8706803.1 hypothetical protein BGZ61DRAFT_227539 [Ilyonectria robusta]